jgi:formamidopyrimidine-DNA glycosylase
MPELPEVETTVRGLQKVLNRTFVDFWTDSKKLIKKPSLERFKKELKNKKIKKVWRRGKNIIFNLSDNYSLLVHQKLTGHLLYGNWKKDKVNTYIHIKFLLDNGKVLALSDLRKFAKIELLKTNSLLKELTSLGPEPLEKEFTFKKFKQIVKNRKIKIKQILMDQKLIAGIGNIYSDEILWRAKIHPLRQGAKLQEKELREIYKYIRPVLKQAIKLKGTSISDYRNIKGEEGQFRKLIKVYQKKGQECPRCKTEIKREKIGSRSTHFCPQCQK